MGGSVSGTTRRRNRSQRWANHVTNLGLYKNVPYDPVNEPALTSGPMALNYASSGNGTGTHLGMEMFMRATGIQLTHIPRAPPPQRRLAVRPNDRKFLRARAASRERLRRVSGR